MVRWLVVGVGLWVVCGCGNGQVPRGGSEGYGKAVSAFYAGVVALEVGALEEAEKRLTQAESLAPGEPAVWANGGVLALRRGNFERAEMKFGQAQRLAPESGRVAFLQGRLAEVRGRDAEALVQFRRAVRLAPEDEKIRFAFAGALERLGEVGEAAGEVNWLVERLPENLALRLEQVRLAARLADGERLREAVRQIRKVELIEEARAHVNALLDAEEDFREVATRVVFLKNVLMREPRFRKDLARVQDRLSEGAKPWSSFLRLEMPDQSPAPADRTLRFEQEVLGDSGGAEAVVIWFDREGEPEVLIVDGREVRLVGSEAFVLRFPGGEREVAPGPAGVVPLDWDNDFRTDLILAGVDGAWLYVQDAAGQFREAEHPLFRTACTGAWGADVEMDGDLDLVVGVVGGAPVVLRNNRDGTVREEALFESVQGISGFVWLDMDGDGVPDAAVLDEEDRLQVFLNERNGKFRLIEWNVEGVLAIAAGDGNGDGVPDLLMIREDGEVVRVDRRNGDGVWQEEGVARWQDFVSEEKAVRLLVADLDNNGAVDLVVNAGAESRAWLGDGGTMQPLPLPEGVAVQAAADVTGDGRIDLVGVAETGVPVRLVNRGVAPYHWQVIRPRAVDGLGDGRINSFAMGGQVEVRSGVRAQRKIVMGPVVHFGLGQGEQADAVRILWPNGTSQAEFGLEVDQEITAVQRLKGSCPWVFTFDGQQMRFVTDFLWRSPLGMRINAQQTAGVMQTEDRVRIGGEMLAVVDGRYEVRITAELWETHFFDHVSLLVVDHPEETEMFLDERFARTLPDLSARLTGFLRSFRRVMDDRGVEVTDRVKELDERYLDTFGRGMYQGLTRDHWVEIIVDEEVPEDRPVWLVAQGWMYPTDSSINVAISQGDAQVPYGLRLEVADASEKWQVVAEDLGFPAGKKKTVLIDLTEALKIGKRIRLRTNLEVYWDRLAWTEPVEVGRVEQRVNAVSAELWYRGFSAVMQVDRSSPEIPEYGVLASTGQVWPDLEGYHTRFGEVRELLEKVDDRYVIMNAGDEMVLSFPAPGPPTPDWRRDFVLIGDGWVKDGDYNTAFSRTVRPLPAHANSAYDASPGRLEEDPVYVRHASDWEAYHTRYVTPQAFQQAMGVGP